MGSEIKYLVRGTLMFILCLVVFYFGKTLLTSNYPPPDQTATIIDYDIEPARVLSEQALRGREIFRKNCAACHKLSSAEFPMSLLEVESRWPNRDLLKLWIKDWRKAVATKDPYPVQLAKSSSAVMTVFDFLTDDEIESILVYIKESENARTSVVACL